MTTFGFQRAADPYVWRVLYFDADIAAQKGHQEITLNDGRHFKYTDYSRQDANGKTTAASLPTGEIVGRYKQTGLWVQEFRRVPPMEAMIALTPAPLLKAS